MLQRCVLIAGQIHKPQSICTLLPSDRILALRKLVTNIWIANQNRQIVCLKGYLECVQGSVGKRKLYIYVILSFMYSCVVVCPITVASIYAYEMSGWWAYTLSVCDTVFVSSIWTTLFYRHNTLTYGSSSFFSQLSSPQYMEKVYSQ